MKDIKFLGNSLENIQLFSDSEKSERAMNGIKYKMI